MKKLLILFMTVLILLAITGCTHQEPSPPPLLELPPITAPEEASPPTPSPPPQTAPPEIGGGVVDVTDFSIIGAWRQTYGASGWESSNGRIVRFTDDNQSNIFSPQDTYGISGRGDGGMWLHVTGLLGGNLDYWVQVIDADNIEVFQADRATLAFRFLRLE